MIKTTITIAPKILITLGVFVYAGIVPYLEINDTHVFNTHWPPHARLHEVWQLITNFSLGIFSLWMVWARNNVYIPSLLGIIIMGSVLIAHMIEETYGGALASGNIKNTFLGMEIAAVAAVLVISFSLIALLVSRAQNKAPLK